MDWRKASLSSSAACGPSGLLGELSRNLRRLLQPRLDRVSTPVTLLVPDAYRHSFCASHTLATVGATATVMYATGLAVGGTFYDSAAAGFYWLVKRSLLLHRGSD